MKKILSLLFILSVLNYSCSKKDRWSLGTGTPLPPPIEYPIDLNFTINPVCNVSYSDDTLYAAVWNKDFEFRADSESNLPDDSSGNYIEVSQSYSYYYEYETTAGAIFHIYPKGQQNPPSGTEYIYMLAREDFNFSALPYRAGIASFSDTCYVMYGNGKYKNIRPKTSPLIFSGTIDLASGTGNIRIKGSVYL